MGVIFIVVVNTVIQCMGFRWCEVYSYESFRQLLSVGLVELLIEVPVVLGLKSAIARIRIYRRKEGEYIDDSSDN